MPDRRRRRRRRRRSECVMSELWNIEFCSHMIKRRDSNSLFVSCGFETWLITPREIGGLLTE